MAKNGVISAKGLLDKIKGEKGVGLIFIIGMLGISAIFLADLFAGGKEEEAPSTTAVTAVSVAECEEQLEKRLTGILEQVEGVGHVQVMVTLESTEEYIFAQEHKQSSDSQEQYTSGEQSQMSVQNEMENSYILVDGQSGSKQALVQTVIEPKIRGVLVVCDGGESPYIQQSVLEAVSKLFDISSAKIHVTN